MVVVTAILAAVPASAASTNVQITGGAGNGFAPASVTVNPGDTVTWTNQDVYPHNASCQSGCPDNTMSTATVQHGESTPYTFQYSGTYNYVCTIHPTMHGTVVVTGDVKNPGSGTSPGGGGSNSSGATPGSGTAPGSGQAAPGGAAAAPGTTPSAGQAADSGSGTSGDAQPATEQDIKDAFAGLTIPPPKVIQTHTTTTPTWIVVASGAGLVLAAFVFGLAWFGSPISIFRRSFKWLG
ncbi:MAG: hypothetical protein QOE92_2441 [Chloroflexota bacterium]|jgi:plastocyanin|nr:hypothetical protein [Chloroflexota bacterium]